MPQTKTIESVEEFIARHSQEGDGLLKVAPDTWLLPDGAMVTNNPLSGTGPRFYEPPLDPRGRLENQRRFAAAKLRTAEDFFGVLKAAVLGVDPSSGERMPHNVSWPVTELPPPPNARPGGGHTPEESKAALLHLRGLIQRYRASLEKIDAELAALPPAVEQRKRDAYAEQLELATTIHGERMANEIASINI